MKRITKKQYLLVGGVRGTSMTLSRSISQKLCRTRSWRSKQRGGEAGWRPGGGWVEAQLWPPSHLAAPQMGDYTQAGLNHRQGSCKPLSLAVKRSGTDVSMPGLIKARTSIRSTALGWNGRLASRWHLQDRERTVSGEEEEEEEGGGVNFGKV